jgi:hypothetical protein
MSIDYRYRVQVRQGHHQYWQTKHAVVSRTQAELLYHEINIGLGWQKRLMSREECLAQAVSQ